MVNLTSVPHYRAPMSQPPSSAAGRRAAGYPKSAADSRPALLRDADFAHASLGDELEGPATPPRLPEVRRRRLLRRGGRGLQQLSAAVLPPGEADAPAIRSSSSDAGSEAEASGCAAGAACFGSGPGFASIDAPPGGTMGMAVGKRHIVQVAGGVMSVYALNHAGGKSTTVRVVSLSAFFAGVAPSCSGVHDGAAVYDKAADRFVVAASCGGFGRLLVAVSATPNAAGTWFMYGLIADAVGTALECKAPKEQALADYPQIGYNRDGLFISYYSYCPSKPAVSGASLLAAPKYKAYQGAPSMFYAVYTAAEVAAAAGLPGGAQAVRQLQPVAPQAKADVAEGLAYFVADHVPADGAERSNFTLVALANTGALWGYAGGNNGVPSPSLVATQVPWGRAAQLDPATLLEQPGNGQDLAAGGAAPRGFWSGGAALSRGKLMLTTRADVSDAAAYSPRPGAIWAEVRPEIDWREASGFANETAFTVQASECPAAVESGMAATFDWSKDFSRAWGSEFARNWSWSLAAYKAAAAIDPRRAPPRAASVVLNRASRLQSEAKSSAAANFQAMAFPRAAGFGGTGAGMGAAVGGKKSTTLRGPNGAGGYRGREGKCGCESSCGYGDLNTYNYVYFYDDYCDAGYNQWGPSTPLDMWGSLYNGAYCVGDGTFGLVGNSQYDQCNRWCYIRCPVREGGIGSFANPNYGFYGITNYYPSFFYASLGEGVVEEGELGTAANATAAGTTNATAAAPTAAAPAAAATAPASAVAVRAPNARGATVSAASVTAASAAAAPAPFTPTKPMKAAACASGVALGATLLRSGSVDAAAATGGRPVGIAFPAVAVASNGAAVIAFTFSGPGQAIAAGAGGEGEQVSAAEATPAGAGFAVVDSKAEGAVAAAALARSAAPIVPAASDGVKLWGELSAADVHPVTGTVYVAARRGGPTRVGRGHVSTWVGVLPTAPSRR